MESRSTLRSSDPIDIEECGYGHTGYNPVCPVNRLRIELAGTRSRKEMMSDEGKYLTENYA